MKKQLRLLQNCFILASAAILILDAKTASVAVREGIRLCIETVIPALFPFLFLSGMLCRIIVGQPIGLLRPLGKILRIPPGSEGILLTGLLGGYPVGATMVTQAYKDGQLSINDGRRMLGFTNQAGPAFLFGMLGPMIDSPAQLWVIWGLQIASALLTAILLPGKSDSICKSRNAEPLSLFNALSNAIHTMANVCGWVILFRVILVFARRWFLWLFPIPIQILLTGLLELSNGCSLLINLDVPGLFIIISSWMLSIGGICVGMQTKSLCKELGMGLYFPGKFLQSCINCLLSSLIVLQSYPDAATYVPWKLPVIALVAAAWTVAIAHRKKVVAFLGRILYNNVSYHLERG